LLPNEALARVMDANLRKVGGVKYDANGTAFAEEIRKSFPADIPPLGSQETVMSFEQQQNGGSTDVGDVSWRVPTAGSRAATWVPGTASYPWQAVGGYRRTSPASCWSANASRRWITGSSSGKTARGRT
jgi:aminobenzoyl-glutamate utilization protein B